MALPVLFGLKNVKSWIAMNAILYDTFTTDDAAPLTSPRTCEPGPGVLVITDTENKFSIVDGDLVCAGGKTTPAYGDPGVWLASAGPAATALLAGYAAFYDIQFSDTGSNERFGIDTNTSASPGTNHFFMTGDAMYFTAPSVDLLGTIADGFSGRFLQAQRSDTNGYFYIIDGILYWFTDAAAAASGYPAICGSDAALTASDIALLPLADYNSAWGGDWTEVTDTKNPASGSFSCEADCHINFTFTVEDTNYIRIYFRYTDVNNCIYWLIGSDRTVKLRSVIDGSVEGLYSGPALTDAQSYEVDIAVEGSTASIWIDKVMVYSGSAGAAGNEETAAGNLNTDYDTNDIVLTTHPYPALGIATSRVVCPQASGNGTHTADALIELKNITPGTDQEIFYFRKNASGGSTEFMGIYFQADGSYILRQVSAAAGSQTLISGSAGSVADGDNLVIVLDGAFVELFINGYSEGSSSSVRSDVYINIYWSMGANAGLSFDSIACFPRDVSDLLPKGTF